MTLSSKHDNPQTRKTQAQKEHEEKRNAFLLNSSTLCNGIVQETFSKELFGDIGALNLMETTNELERQVEAVQQGHLHELEAMLLSQSKALQTMFSGFVQRAERMENFMHYQAFMGMAFKAQAQSRATVQTLIDLKHPKQVIMTKQANITSGNQQVNNTVKLKGAAPDQVTSVHPVAPVVPATPALNGINEDTILNLGGMTVTHETMPR